MSTIALLSRRFSLAAIKPLLEAHLPDATVVDWQDPDAAKADVVVCWDPPEGVWRDFPNVRLIHSVGAGVDLIVRDPSLPKVPVCRISDPDLARQMTEYITWGVLFYYRGFDTIQANQRSRRWQRIQPSHPNQYHVGVLGLGALGMRVATRLQSEGFRVRGWSRSFKQVPDVASYHGQDMLLPFCEGLDALICLIPLTSETRGILCASTFNALPVGTALIHCGRGEHLVEADLVTALSKGHLRGAIVDVFEQEPLPEDSPLWSTPNLTLTPHMAANSSFESIAGQVAHNVRQLQVGGVLANTVNVTSGY